MKHELNTYELLAGSPTASKNMPGQVRSSSSKRPGVTKLPAHLRTREITEGAGRLRRALPRQDRLIKHTGYAPQTPTSPPLWSMVNVEDHFSRCRCCAQRTRYFGLSLSRARAVRGAHRHLAGKEHLGRYESPLKMAFGLILYKSSNTESGACKCQVEVETRICAFMGQHQTFPQAL